MSCRRNQLAAEPRIPSALALGSVKIAARKSNPLPFPAAIFYLCAPSRAVIPKYAGCVNGVNWFKDRGQWAENDIEPAPGMIIFFDWDNKGSSGPQDGESDHTGIVERVEDGIVYTVEGNSGDSCRENHYAVGYYEILGYGIPAY